MVEYRFPKSKVKGSSPFFLVYLEKKFCINKKNFRILFLILKKSPKKKTEIRNTINICLKLTLRIFITIRQKLVIQWLE